MQVVNDVYPSEAAQIEALREKGPDGPVFMVNLLKFKDKAEYEDGRATMLACAVSSRLPGSTGASRDR